MSAGKTRSRQTGAGRAGPDQAGERVRRRPQSRVVRLWEQLVAVVAVRHVDRRQRVVTQHSVLDGKHGHRRHRVLHEQAVVADAQTEQHIELGPRQVQSSCLAQRFAHALELPRVDLVLVAQTKLFLGQAAVLADDRVDREAVRPEHAAGDGGLRLKADAEGEAQFGVAAAAGEVHDLFDAGEAAVAVRLHEAGVSCQMCVVALAVQPQHLGLEGLPGWTAAGV